MCKVCVRFVINGYMLFYMVIIIDMIYDAYRIYINPLNLYFHEKGEGQYFFRIFSIPPPMSPPSSPKVKKDAVVIVTPYFNKAP